MSSTASSSNGIGLTGILLAAFILLKITGYTVVATWSWWSVLLLPFAISIGLVLFFLGVALTVGLVIAGVGALFSR